MWQGMFPILRPEVLLEVVYPDRYNRAPHTNKRGLADARATVARSRDAVTDLRCQVLDVIANGDRVAVFCRVAGRHNRPLRGLEATGRSLASGQVHVLRFRDGLQLLRDLVVPSGPSWSTTEGSNG